MEDVKKEEVAGQQYESRLQTVVQDKTVDSNARQDSGAKRDSGAR